jgi:hypothetical protein
MKSLPVNFNILPSGNSTAATSPGSLPGFNRGPERYKMHEWKSTCYRVVNVVELDRLVCRSIKKHKTDRKGE